MKSSDPEIRAALHHKVLSRHHKCCESLVIDELGLSHGKRRIDVAVINGALLGYEIKSSKDTLSRFSAQLEEYIKAFQKLTVVASPEHVQEVIEISPSWVGILQAVRGSRGAIHFKTIRRARKNPDVDLFWMAHLLWREEVSDVLASLGHEKHELAHPRRHLYQVLAAKVSEPFLVSCIKEKFKDRETKRVGLPLVSYGG